MSSPQMIISLSPTGELVTELPGLNGSRRKVILIRGEAEEKIRHILQAQLKNKIEIGLDGAPTQSQVKHWENHGILCQDPNCKKNQNGSRPHSHESLWSDPSCPHCKSEGRFEPGFNREDTRKLRGLSEYEALRLGLVSRGFVQSKNNPEIWTKKNMGTIFLLPNGKVRDHKQVEWSDGHRKALISDGKIHAKAFGFNPVPPRQGAGKAKKLVKMVEKEPKAKKLIQISATI